MKKPSIKAILGNLKFKIDPHKVKGFIDFVRDTILAIVKHTKTLVLGNEEPLNKVRFRRILAFLIDILTVFGIAHYFDLNETIVIFIYFILLEGVIGKGTIGKLITRVSVNVEDANDNGEEEFRSARLFIRTIIKAIAVDIISDASDMQTLTVLVVVYFFVTFRFSSEGRAVHDILAGTYVDSLTEEKIAMGNPNRIYASFEDWIAKVQDKRKVNEYDETNPEPDNLTSKKEVPEDELDELY